MRTLLLLGFAVGGAFMAGWFTIDRNDGRTLIEINKDEIRADTRQAIDKGRDLLEKREQERLARQQQSGGGFPDQATWPQQGDWASQSGGVQGTGYAGPVPYSAQTPYSGQPPYGEPPAYGEQTQYGQQAQFGQQPQYGPQPQFGQQTQYDRGPGYNANYPAPLDPQAGNLQSTPRWTEMPPPWQQQTR